MLECKSTEPETTIQKQKKYKSEKKYIGVVLRDKLSGCDFVQI